MRGIKIMGPCVAVAVCALACAFASSASALGQPEWYSCKKVVKTERKYTGAYNNKTCSEPNASKEGKYELEAGIGKGKSFKGKSGETGLVVASPYGGQRIACKSSKDEGSELAPNRESNVTVTFSGCAFGAVGGSTKCQTHGEKPGVIVTKNLNGVLGYVEESPVEVGVKLTGGNEEGVIAEFECTYLKEGKTVVTVSGKVAGELIGLQQGDVGQVSKESKIVFLPGKNYGEHEFAGKKYTPLVNIIGWASERAGILAAEEANEEETDPAHVLKGVYCGEIPEELLSEECTPPTYSGEELTATNKGEALEIAPEPEVVS